MTRDMGKTENETNDDDFLFTKIKREREGEFRRVKVMPFSELLCHLY